MGVMQVQLPDDLEKLITRQVAEGRVASEAAYLEEAIRRYAEDLDTEDGIIAVAEAAITDIETGRYVTIAKSEDAEALHQRTMARLRAQLAADPG